MSERLRFRMFAHSWMSDWNHGNAHFLRGLAHELTRLGHQVKCYEEEHSWSRTNLLKEETTVSEASLGQFRETFPDLDVGFYNRDSDLESWLDEQLRDADIVLIHEWNSPELVNAVLEQKRKHHFHALFHDTHHRAYTNPKEILAIDLERFDGILAFGAAIKHIYEQGFGMKRVWTFHEAADTAHFYPMSGEKVTDVVWVGNWGDEERTRELEEYFLKPVSRLGSRVCVHGVRYPESAISKLARAGIEFRGYLPNLEAPRVYAQSKLTVHVPRRFYANGLSGVPTIRVFEALACGIPLLCSPWTDTEGLFSEGEDYLCLRNGEAMKAEIRHFLDDDRARSQLAEHAFNTVRRRHTCAHRAQQLLEICEELER